MARDRCGRICLRTLGAASSLVMAAVLFAQQPVLSDGTQTPSGVPPIQQILKTNCQPCHNDATRTNGLALTTRDSILAGGNRGAAIKPGYPAESLLVRAIEQSGDLKMPPGKKLQPDEISSIRRWIELGAAWTTDEAAASRPKGWDWWRRDFEDGPVEIVPVSLARKGALAAARGGQATTTRRDLRT